MSCHVMSCRYVFSFSVSHVFDDNLTLFTATESIRSLSLPKSHPIYIHSTWHLSTSFTLTPIIYIPEIYLTNIAKEKGPCHLPSVHLFCIH